MKRTVIPLTPNEIVKAIELLQTSQEDMGLFVQKLQAGYQQNQQETGVQVSEDELERLIDLMPPPGEEVESILVELRKKVTQTLTQLRFPKS